MTNSEDKFYDWLLDSNRFSSGDMRVEGNCLIIRADFILTKGVLENRFKIVDDLRQLLIADWTESGNLHDGDIVFAEIYGGKTVHLDNKLWVEFVIRSEI